MLPRRARRRAKPETLAAIDAVTEDIRDLASEERILRQELGLPPVTLTEDPRWTSVAPALARVRALPSRGR